MVGWLIFEKSSKGPDIKEKNSTPIGTAITLAKLFGIRNLRFGTYKREILMGEFLPREGTID